MDSFKLYSILCGAVSDALDVLPYLPENVHARFLLEKGLRTCEELFLRAEEDEA